MSDSGWLAVAKHTASESYVRCKPCINEINVHAQEHILSRSFSTFTFCAEI